MPEVNTVITDNTFVLVVDGKPYTTDRSNANWGRIKQALVDLVDNPDKLAVEDLINLMSPAATISAAAADFGEIEVVDGVLYFDGEEVDSSLAERIIDIYSEGLPLDPWVSFAKNVYANPDTRARDELYLWLEKASLPITTDGHFLAYKRVRSDFLDIYTGTMDNSPGKIVSMPREEVDTNRDRTCSQGLHFCSKDYLPHFGVRPGNTTVVVKINPADVVSIPSDYDNAKGRTWRYEVLYELDDDPMSKAWNPVESTTSETVQEYAERLADEKAAARKPKVGDHVVVQNYGGDKNHPYNGQTGIVTSDPTTRGESFYPYSLRMDKGQYAYDNAFLVEESEIALITNEKTNKPKKKDKKLATKTKNKKAVTINTVELGTLSRKQFKTAVKEHGSVAAWARHIGVKPGTVGKWKARLWPKDEG